MKKIITLTLSLSLSLSLLKADYWTQKASLTGGARYVAVGFSIGNKGYIGTGYGTAYLNDFWEYDPASNSWTQKANLAGIPRYFASGCAIGSKGYLGLGQDPGGYLQDFWAYDPATNSWMQVANFGGGARGFQATAFSLNGYGYVGLGFDGVDRQDFWQYDTLLNTWTQKSNFGGAGMEQAVCFTVGNKAYVGTGETSVPMYAHKDFWEYDPVTDSWTQLVDFPGVKRFSAAAFSIGPFGYVGTGYDSTNTQHNDFYQYNVAANTWIQKTNVGGPGRSHGVGFAIGSKGYIGTGMAPGFVDDFWEYTPDSTTSIEEFEVSGLKFEIAPNPASQYAIISWQSPENKKIEITVTDAGGKKVYETKVLVSDFRLPTSDFEKGFYFVTVDNGKQKVVKKFLKE